MNDHEIGEIGLRATFLAMLVSFGLCGCGPVAEKGPATAGPARTNQSARAVMPPLPVVEAKMASVKAITTTAMMGEATNLSLRAIEERANLFAALPSTNKGSIKLAWDASPDPETIGYRVWFHLIGTSIEQVADIGLLKNVTISGLVEGAEYEFYVTAYNAAQIDSMPSNRVTTRIRPKVYLRQGAWFIESYGVAGKTNVVQMTTNLTDWVNFTNFVGNAGVFRSFPYAGKAPSASFRILVLP